MIFTIPTIRLGRYTPSTDQGQYLSCELIPDETSHEYTLVTLDREGEMDMRSVDAKTGSALLDSLEADGYIRTDPYIPSMRKQAMLGKTATKDDTLLKKLRGQGGSDTAEKLQKGKGKASKWDGGIIDSCTLGSVGMFEGSEEEETPSEEIITDAELDALSASLDATDSESDTPDTGLSLPSGHRTMRVSLPSSTPYESRDDMLDDDFGDPEDELEDDLLILDNSDLETEALVPPVSHSYYDDDSLDGEPEEEEPVPAPAPSSFLARLQEASKKVKDQEIEKNLEKSPEPSMVKEPKKRTRQPKV